MRRLTISTSKVNRNGYRVLPQGIDLTEYKKNPVLMVEHRHQIVSIGRVEDLRIEEDPEIPKAYILTGSPVFDVEDSVGKEYARKYENGFINACSMGHNPIETSTDESLVLAGQIYGTVTKTELLEISMCNIPGDRDAVGGMLQLSKGNGGDLARIPKLELKKPIEADNSLINEKMDLTKINKQLGLNSDASEEDVIKAIETLQLSLKANQEDKVDSLMKLGRTKGFITDENEENYKKLAALDYTNVASIIGDAEETSHKEEKTETLTVADILKLSSTKDTPTEDKESFDWLQKNNPVELLRIKNEDPEKYAKLTADYSKG